MDMEAEDSSITITRQLLYEVIRNSNQTKFEDKFIELDSYLINLTKCPDEEIPHLKHKISHFKSQFKERWQSAKNTADIFSLRNQSWLNQSVTFPSWKKPRSGRPTKPFNECSERTRRRKTEELREENSLEELTYATQMCLRKSGQKDVAKMLKDATSSEPDDGTKLKKNITMVDRPVKLSPTQALSVFVEADLTRRQYEIIRGADKTRYPCYSILQKEKALCYPDKNCITVTSTSAEVDLQPLLDHTATRLSLGLYDVLERISDEEKMNLRLISKWGCDGSQQAQYKQRFDNDSESDANIFQSSFAYLQLVSCINDTKKVIWQNPTPSSQRYCRPIRIRFVQESTDVTNEEVAYIESKINALKDTMVMTAKGNLRINHKMLFTMVDGKVCNAVTGTKYTQRCYLCGATSTKFNDLNDMTAFKVNPDHLRYGLSILHARIRFFESLLHLSYKLPVKEWQVKKDSPNKKIVEERKKSIQQSFREELGLLVDIPKQGFGNTNDGNSSRKFFSNIEKSAEITGLDPRLLHRYRVILEAISSGHELDVDKFASYSLDTAKLYVKLYSWYPMPPTVHKVLIHGAEVINSAILPIGQLSEEAAEARNKHFRQYREGFSRKFSREACNQDVLNRLLLRSDPLLASLKPKPIKRSRPFLKETLDLMVPAKVFSSTQQPPQEMSRDEEESYSDTNESEDEFE